MADGTATAAILNNSRKNGKDLKVMLLATDVTFLTFDNLERTPSVPTVTLAKIFLFFYANTMYVSLFNRFWYTAK